MEDKKKKFDPLAKDWLMGDVGKKSDQSQEEPELQLEDPNEHSSDEVYGKSDILQVPLASPQKAGPDKLKKLEKQMKQLEEAVTKQMKQLEEEITYLQKEIAKQKKLYF